MIKILCLSLFILGIFAGAASGYGHWDKDYSGDWLGAGPIYQSHYEPYYYPINYNTIYWNWDYSPYYWNWEDYPYYWDWEDYPFYHSVYYPIYSIHYPHYYDDSDHFVLGTFGEKRGGNY